MRSIVTFFLSFVISPILLQAQITREFTNYSMGNPNAAAFTTNNFKCIGVGKGNRIWAGTQYGGLYTYDDNGLNVWLKSSKLTNVFINDIKADPDSGIWIAQSGTTSMGGNSNIAGGVNLFRVASDLSMEFYSVLGTTTSADLLSRNVRSLYIDQNYKAANGQLPRPWAAQGTFISSFNTKRGGLSIGVNAFSPFFTNLGDGFSPVSTATPFCESLGGNRQEVWAGVRMNNGGSQILRYTPYGKYLGLYDTTGTKLSTGFTAQAIFFDSHGNRWIGMKEGGLVVKTPTAWLKVDAPSLIPAGTQINYNAFTEDEYGNVYIGTSNGLLEYLSPDYNLQSSPDYTPSYNLLTTNDGLPNNNITGLAYDKKNSKLLITSSAGVTFMNSSEPHIKGVVFDVTCKPDNEDNPYPGLQKQPFRGGLVTARLLKNGVEEDFMYVGFDGGFEFTRANDIDNYTVEIKFVRNSRTIKYLYNNIRNHTRLQPILIPDGLIEEIKAFKASMQNRCFPLKTTMGAEINLDIFCVDGFKTGLYEEPGEKFYVAEGISSDHKKRVDNLAAYFLAMKTVYKLGGNATDLFSDMVANAIDVTQALGELAGLGLEIKKGTKLPDDPLKKAGIEDKALKEGLIAMIGFMKEGINHVFTKLASQITDPDKKTNIERCIGLVNDAADLCLYFMKDGQEGLAVNFFIDNLKKVIALAVTTSYYSDDYAGERHQYFVPEASLNAGLNRSEKSYEETFDLLYSQVNESLAKKSADTVADRKSIIEGANRVAKYTDYAGQVADAGRTLALIPGAQAAAGVFAGVSFFAKAVKTFSLGVAVYFAAVGCGEVEDMSDRILTEAQLQRTMNYTRQLSPVITQDQPTLLIANKNDYNLKLTALQAVYNSSTYDSAIYRNSYYAFKRADSLYTNELNKTLHKLAASADSANLYVPGFTSKFGKVMDSFITQQYTLRHALFFRNLAYIYDPVKANHRAGLDSLSNEIKVLNDSSVNGIVYLINDINNNGIPAPAYLIEDSMQLTHSHVPGSTGSVRFYFTNYGAQAQNNVRFKMKYMKAGYSLTGSDSVNVGTILPGTTKQVNFTFQSPMHDSLGQYLIEVKADNGSYKNVYGTLYVEDPAKFFTVKDGNWTDPTTWHKNAVPGNNNSVYINHTVTVTADASCKTVTMNKPGHVIVNTGKRINILQ